MHVSSRPEEKCMICQSQMGFMYMEKELMVWCSFPPGPYMDGWHPELDFEHNKCLTKGQKTYHQK